ncbi:10217_t:CDS:10, partial [Ambispora gerdemannii]
YWERDSASWGSVADWDLYFINNMPGASHVQSHRTLARELKALVNYFDEGSCEWNKVKGLKKELKVFFCLPGVDSMSWSGPEGPTMVCVATLSNLFTVISCVFCRLMGILLLTQSGSMSRFFLSSEPLLLKKTKGTMNSTIWMNHEMIQKTVVESKINESINKRKIENIARDVTSATAKAYYTQSGSDYYETNSEGAQEMAQKRLCSDSTNKAKGNNVIRDNTPLQTSTEPICSNIIDTTNKNLMARLQLERDYYVEAIFNATTKYIDELIENSHNRSDLRKKLQTPFLPPEETYLFEKHYEINWAHRFTNKLLSFFEAPRNPLLDKNSEGWINCHLLTPLIDDCFLTCEEIQIHRCEEMSLASIARKNLSREESNKKQPGHKIDIIFRVDDMEYFGAETFVDGDFQNSGPINYKHKLFREMKDQLDRLLKKLKFTKETIKLVKQIVLHGISHGGYNGIVYAMYYDINLKYYFVFEMCQYRIGTTWNSVPDSLNILKDILHLKKGIIHTLGIVTRIKKNALQTRSKELLSIDNLPETTRSPRNQK